MEDRFCILMCWLWVVVGMIDSCKVRIVVLFLNDGVFVVEWVFVCVVVVKRKLYRVCGLVGV